MGEYCDHGDDEFDAVADYYEALGYAEQLHRDDMDLPVGEAEFARKFDELDDLGEASFLRQLVVVSTGVVAAECEAAASAAVGSYLSGVAAEKCEGWLLPQWSGVGAVRDWWRELLAFGRE